MQLVDTGQIQPCSVEPQFFPVVCFMLERKGLSQGIDALSCAALL
jgi:hypothetical protein